MSQILLIGYGAVGQYVFNALKTSTHSHIKALLCRPGREKSAQEALCSNAQESLGSKMSFLSNLNQIDASIDLAVECAGHQAMINHVPTLLRRGIDVIGVSNGALSDAHVAAQLEHAAVEGGATLQLLAGAVGGMDTLSAARNAGLTSVRYRGSKPPEGWKGSLAEKTIDLDAITEPITHFTGTAREAARDYPKNANVAATVALAGVGLDKTRVELVADPALSVNRHEIEAIGAFGQFSFVINGNALPGNPRSSALTAMSIVQAIERRNVPILVG